MARRRRRALWLTLGLLAPHAAGATFTSQPTASATYATHTLATPVLTCEPGGLLVSNVTLYLDSADDTSVDPYGTGGAKRIAGYVIERTGVDDNNYAVLATVAVVSSYVDTLPGALLGTFKYRIKAYQGAHWVSPYSNIATVNKTNVLFIGLSTTCDT